MRLVSAVVGFALRKAGLLVALVTSLFVVLLLTQYLVPAVSEAVSRRDRLPEVARERAALEQDLEQLRDRAESAQSRADSALQIQISDARSELAAARSRQDDVCSLLNQAVDALTPGSACRTAQRAVEGLERAVSTLEAGIGRTPDVFLAVEIDNTQEELARKQEEQSALEQAQSSLSARVVDQWFRTWPYLLGTALLVVFLPYVLRTAGYFVLMPVVSRAHRPIRLAAGRETPTSDLRTAAAERTLTVRLRAGEVLSARSEHVRPVQGTVRSQLLYDWRSPFISFAAGLYGLSRVTGGAGGSSATLSTPDDPDSYLMRIDFTDHPGVVVHPRHVVGVLGTPRLEKHWRWGVQAFATWQLRYIAFAGTGSLVVEGSGDVVATRPAGGSVRMEQHLVMGFDSRLAVGVDRTEVFVPYLRGRTPLVDDEFTGTHPFFWQKSNADGPRNPVARTFSAFFSGLGKLLGF